MILIINTSAESLHYYEFVKPIEKIIEKEKLKHKTSHYTKLTKKDLENCSKVIICGTSLKDNEYIKDLNFFSWIKNFNKPILGICSGMQIIGLISGAKLKKQTEIGFFELNFIKKFLKLIGKISVYHLHNNYVELPKGFLKYNAEKTPQAFKYKSRPIYGILFHPEIRNKELIVNFLNF